MKLSTFAQKLIKDFLVIFASIIIIITILRQIYYPELTFHLTDIYIIMGFSLISSLVGFILYSPHEISEKNMRIRMFLHFFTLEIVLIALGSVFDIVNSGLEVIILTFQIAIIYFLVRLLSWKKDKKEAQKINEKLKTFQEKQL